jgi:hypothetical protein
MAGDHRTPAIKAIWDLIGLGPQIQHLRRKRLQAEARSFGATVQRNQGDALFGTLTYAVGRSSGAMDSVVLLHSLKCEAISASARRSHFCASIKYFQL